MENETVFMSIEENLNPCKVAADLNKVLKERGFTLAERRLIRLDFAGLYELRFDRTMREVGSEKIQLVK